MSEEPIHPPKPSLPREPNAYPGGEQVPGGPVPPYEGRQTSGPSQEEQAGEGSMAGPRDISQAEREGVPSTDTTAASPHGAGVSKGNRGNEKMYGRSDEAHDSDRLDGGVGGRSENIDPSSPTMPTGDQGG